MVKLWGYIQVDYLSSLKKNAAGLKKEVVNSSIKIGLRWKKKQSQAEDFHEKKDVRS